MTLDPFREDRLGNVYFLSYLQALIVSFLRLSHVNREPESRLRRFYESNVKLLLHRALALNTALQQERTTQRALTAIFKRFIPLLLL